MKVKDNSTVCFFGDSITANGLWIKDIWENIHKCTRKLFNCGIPGDSTVNAKSRIYETCLIHAPDYVTVMFGMNDIGRNLYLDDENKGEREKRLNIYKESMDEIINTIMRCGAEPILITPTPYDEYSDAIAKNLKCNAGIDACVEIMHELAQKYSLFLIDFNSEFKKRMIKEKIVGPDRVHPNNDGHKVMAQSFLRAIEIETAGAEETPQNRRRYETEQELIRILFVDYALLADKLKGGFAALDDKKKMCREMMDGIADGESNDRDFIKKMCINYIENGDTVTELRRKLVRLTLE